MKKLTRYCMSTNAKRELNKFIELVGGIKSASLSLNISRALIHYWKTDRILIQEKHAKKIEELTCGEILKEILLEKTPVGLDYETSSNLSDFIFHYYISKNLSKLNLTKEFYIENCICSELKNLFENKFNLEECNLSEEDVVNILILTYGGTENYWLNNLNKFKQLGENIGN